MKKILTLLLSIALISPPQALAPLALGADSSPAPSPDRPSLEGIRVEDDGVTLDLTGPARHNTFVTANPPRLVLEILDTDFGHAPKQLEGRGTYVKRVRSGQFMGGTSPISRVVIDLTRAVDYRVVSRGNQLQVLLGSAEKPARALVPVTQLAAASSPPKPALTDAPAEAGSGSVKETTPEDAGSMSTENSEELAAIATQGSVIAKAGGAALGAVTPQPAPSRPTARRNRRDLLATLPRDPVTLDFDDTDIGDILKLLAAKANVNMIYGSDVSGMLTLHISDVPFNEAFNLILSMKGLVASQAGENVVRVMTPETLSKERSNAVGVTRVFSLNYIKAIEAKTTVDAVRAAEKRSGMTVADDKNNTLIVTDVPEGLAAAERLLGQIVVRPRQVLIEAKLVEVSLNKDLELGIQWDYFGMDGGKLFGQQGTNVIGSNVYPTGTLSKPFDRNALTVTAQPPVGGGGRGTGVILPADKIFGAFTFGRITNNYFLSATLTAAAAQGKVKVLSDPKIATINGKEAKINITTQIPYVTSTVASTGVTSQAVSYTTTGIQLSVTPTINADGRITLKVTPNVSKPSAVAATAGTTGAVAVDTRQADTNVIVKDGETIVIGGLITDSISHTEGKIPLLGDIPILGWLFKKKTVIRQRVELLIFVTTRILPD
ncbi:MAG: type IV pilus secretin PilQ [Elusimicrobia bacterium]|nr:type IV pilus secretin PilQ [Elusimicrobiota bacterium]